MKRNHAFMLIEGNNDILSRLFLVNDFTRKTLPGCVSDADKGIKKDGHCTTLVVRNEQ